MSLLRLLAFACPSWVFLTFLAGIPASSWGGPVSGQEILVLSAASTAPVMERVAQRYAAAGGGRVRFAFAGSSALARQVMSGAPADVFLSANARWMDEVDRRGRLLEGSRTALFGNRLVLIAPPESTAQPVDFGQSVDFQGLLGRNGRLALAEPEAVPAGIYAREALASLGAWPDLRDRIAPTAHVRMATELVRRGESPLGIVYRTEITGAEDLRVLGTVPEDAHSPIVYWAAVLRDAPSRDAALRFLEFLKTPDTARVLRQFGFVPPS